MAARPGTRRRRSAPKTGSQPLTDLQACIAFLDQAGRLARVCSEVDPRHELAGIARRFEGGKCVLFERVKGSDYPVLAGLLWNRATIGALFGLAQEQLPFAIAGAIAPWRQDKAALPARLLEDAPANEVVMAAPDLSQLPIPVHALKDGGAYLDASVVLARNPRSGALNSSVHRIMITGKDRSSFLIDPTRHLGEYVALAEERGEPLAVTINNGVGLAPWIVSTLPRLGDGKPAVAHHLVGRPIDLVRARTVDVPAYADAQFVIEAEILPGEREWEAPFGEVTGYYGTRERRRVMRVKAISHRAHPVFHTLITGREVWNAVGLTAEASIFHTVKATIPQIRAVHLPHGGCGFYAAVVQADNARPGIGPDLIRATFDAFPSLQRVVAVDTDVDLFDPVDVEWAITTRFNADRDLLVLPRQEGHILNPMVAVNPDGRGGTVTKVGIDAMVPFEERGSPRFERVRFMDVDLGRYDIV